MLVTLLNMMDNNNRGYEHVCKHQNYTADYRFITGETLNTFSVFALGSFITNLVSSSLDKISATNKRLCSLLLSQIIKISL